MNRKLISTIVLISVFGVTACSKASNEQTKVDTTAKSSSQNVNTELSASDKAILGEFKHEVRQFQKPYDNQQAEQISLMV